MKWSMVLSISLLIGLTWINIDVTANQKHQEDNIDLDELLRQSEKETRKKREPNEAPVTAPPGTAPQMAKLPADQCKATGKAAVKGQPIQVKMEKKERKVLKAIRDGQDKPNDYIAVDTVVCSSDDNCRQVCNKEGCNYFVSYRDRSKSNLTFLYIIKEEILKKTENYVDSNQYNSYILKYNTVRKAPKTSTNARPRQRRQPSPSCCSFCSPCDFAKAAGAPINNFYCRFFCGGNLLGLIVGLSVGLGVGIGVGVGVPVGVSQSVSQSAAAAAAAAAAQAQAQAFQSFQQTNSVTYSSAQAQAQAQQTFVQNSASMSQSNSQNQKADDASQGVTQFAATSLTSFLSSFTGALTNGPIQPVQFHMPMAELIPTPLALLHWDQASSQVLPPVRYQGECGACYAFTSADLIASQNAAERMSANREVPTQELSVQYLIDCGGQNASVGCKGGRPAVLLHNLANSQGAPFESCYQYQTKAGKCQMQKAEKCCERQKVKFSQLIDISGPHEKEYMANILNWGPVIAIVGANQQWMFYTGNGTIKARQCDSKVHNHAVMIVGYNYNKTETSTPYYIVRNSWGVSWGINGYAKLEAGKNTCGVANYVLVTCTADCRNVKSVRDLINRSNVPDPYLQKHAPKKPSNTKPSRPGSPEKLD